MVEGYKFGETQEKPEDKKNNEYGPRLPGQKEEKLPNTDIGAISGEYTSERLVGVKERQEKNDLKNTEDLGTKTYETAVKISPESTSQINPAYAKFKEEISKIEKTDSKDTTDEKRKEDIDKAIKEYNDEIIKIVGSTEGGQSQQGANFKKFVEELEKTRLEKNYDYSKELQKISEKLTEIHKGKAKEKLTKLGNSDIETSGNEAANLMENLYEPGWPVGNSSEGGYEKA